MDDDGMRAINFKHVDREGEGMADEVTGERARVEFGEFAKFCASEGVKLMSIAN